MPRAENPSRLKLFRRLGGVLFALAPIRSLPQFDLQFLDSRLESRDLGLKLPNVGGGPVEKRPNSVIGCFAHLGAKLFGELDSFDCRRVPALDEDQPLGRCGS